MNATIDAPTVGSVLAGLFSELVRGPEDLAYMLNRGDRGMIGSLARIDSRAADRDRGGASIAAHVDHLRYSLSLINRYAAGESDVYSEADWAQSWKVSVGSDEEWAAIREAMEEQALRWIEGLAGLGVDRPLDAATLREAVASVAHFAYHLGAVRQIDRAARGPTEEEVRAAR